MTQTQTRPYIEEFPVLPAKRETNREAIIRVLREADGVVEQCYGSREYGDKRCALGVLDDAFGYSVSYDMGHKAGLVHLNDDKHLTFAQIANLLESDPSYWYAESDLPYKGER